MQITLSSLERSRRATAQVLDKPNFGRTVSTETALAPVAGTGTDKHAFLGLEQLISDIHTTADGAKVSSNQKAKGIAEKHTRK